MYGYGYRYNSGLVIGAGGGAPFANTKSLSFDGVDDGLSISEVVYSDAFTFSFWAKPTTLSLAFICGDINSNGNFIWLFSATRVMLKINAVAYTFIESGGNNIVIGEWQNIVITRDSSNNINCYRNGLSFGTSSNLGGNFEFNSIGEVHRAIGNWHFNGGLDEFAVWDNDQSSNIATISTAPTVDLTSLNPTQWYRNGDNGSYKSPQWLIPNNENFAANKVSNYSTQFDGVDDYVTMDSASSIFSSAYSVSFWFNGDSFPSGGPGGRVLFSLHDASGGNLLLLYANTSGTLITYNNTAIRTTGTTTTNTETWNNCIITSDGTNMKLYKNGTLEDTNSVGNFTTGTVGRVTLGQEWDGASPSDFYNGKLDEVSFFNSVLSQSEVTSIYNSGEPATISGAAAHYKMGEDATFSGGVWTVPDEVGSNDGTSANMTIEDRIGEAPNSENNAVSLNMDEVDRTTDVPT